MEKSRLETKVGLFVFIGLTLLAVLLIQFSKGTSLFHGTYMLRLHAENVGGLKQRASVLLAGVQVGSVSGIELAPDGKSVTILLRIYRNYKIYADAQFIIQQSGFLGDQYVAIIPTLNKAPLLQDGSEVECLAPFNLQEVARSASGFIQRIDDTARKLDATLGDVRRYVLNEETLTNLSAAVSNLRDFTEQATGMVASLNALVSTNGTQIHLAVSNVVFFSQDLIGLSDAAHGLISTNAPEISAAVKNLKTSSETLNKLMDNLQSGNGLAGTLLNNQELSTNVQIMAANLAVATSNLNRLGLWRFLFHHELPRTNAPPSQPAKHP